MSSPVILLVQKDLRCLTRARGRVAMLFGFAGLLAIVSSFAFRSLQFDRRDISTLAPGVFWLCALFSGVSLLQLLFLPERERKASIAACFALGSASELFISKQLVSTCLLTALQLFTAFLLALFLGIDWIPVFPQLALLALLGAVGFSALGGTLAAFAVVSAHRDILLPLILFPLLVPFSIGMIELLRHLTLEGAIEFSSFWFTLLCVCDLVWLVLGWVLFDYTTFD